MQVRPRIHRVGALAGWFVFLLMLLAGEAFGQARPYEGPDDPAGDIAAIREGYMTGNRVLLYFKNTTEMAYWPNFDQSKWPNDESGTGMLDGVALYIGAQVFIRNDVPGFRPVTSEDSIEVMGGSGLLDTLYFVETNFRQGMDTNPTGTVRWGLYPVFGYFNENNEYVAMSNRPESWPPEGWPSRGDEKKWPGEWDGRFGRGVKYADLEAYFVANDAQDQEYLQDDAPVKYYPRPGVRIGDKRPDVTIQKGRPWGGIGIRVKVRMYQWNNIQARDAIFWEYDIANISDYTLPRVAFGYLTDTGIGHKGYQFDQDDLGYFDEFLDMAYFWDVDGVGIGGVRPGIMGLAFLESPGNSTDGVDNDEDGLIDEKRDNLAEQKVGPYDGIADLGAFLQFYGLEEKDLHEHWDADEDQDWVDGNDANGNGIYDGDENPGDDVGLDGVGPGELNYTAPDPDGTECNHKPDFLEGYGCEPNFAATDVSESDMIGLTAFRIFDSPDMSRAPAARDDEGTYKLLSSHNLIPWTGEVGNLYTVFGTGPFPLPKGNTERISMAELHSYDELAGLQSSEHSAPALFQKKQIVQGIYESDYRFAQPPRLPTLKAYAGDGRVVLIWDDVADRFTREPLLRGANDFEGYKLYRSTDKHFLDAQKITDMYGNVIEKKPIFQCDLKDGRVGAASFAQFNGVSFNLGNDTGIQHYFIDTDVQNGRTYYYALVAYDYGIQGKAINIMPSENNAVIDLDENENVIYTGSNVAIVTPRQKAAGYVPPAIEVLRDRSSDLPQGLISFNVLNPEMAREGAIYVLKFQADTLGHLRKLERFRSKHDVLLANNGFSVYRVREGKGDTLIYRESPLYYPRNNLVQDLNGRWRFNDRVVSDPFEGLQLEIESAQDPELDVERTGWIKGDAPIQVWPSAEESRYFAWDYEIVFASDSLYRTRVKTTKGITNEEGVELGDRALLGHAFNFVVVNTTFDEPDTLDLVVEDVDGDGRFDPATDLILAGPIVRFGPLIGWGGTVFAIDLRDAVAAGKLPQPGDVYRVAFKRPFLPTDSLVFRVKPAVTPDRRLLDEEMEKIRVVPNPYIATNAMEPALSNPNLNQQRRLMFTHIPANCDIKIFTSSGVLVDEIHVRNAPDNGIVHWDMLTKEGLEIAAGIYIYYIRSLDTGKEKIGKFAVVK